jgi:ATP-dependent Lon protease
LKNDIQSKVRFDLDQQQREYFLHQQMKPFRIRWCFSGRRDGGKCSLSLRLRNGMSKRISKELSKMRRMNPQTPDFGIQRNYLELLLELPWNEYSKDNFDLKRCSENFRPRSFWF